MKIKIIKQCYLVYTGHLNSTKRLVDKLDGKMLLIDELEINKIYDSEKLFFSRSFIDKYNNDFLKITENIEVY